MNAPRWALGAATFLLLACKAPTGDKLAQQGVEAAYRGEHAPAAALFQRALDTGLDTGLATVEEAEVRLLLARAHEGAGDLVQARAAYDELLAKFPDSAQGWLGLVDLIKKQGDEAEAAATLQRAIAAAPGNATLLLRAGMHALEANKPELARAHFEVAVEAQPGHAPSCAQLALLGAGRGEFAVADQFLMRAVQSGYPDGVAMKTRIEALKAGGEPDPEKASAP